MTEIEKLEKLKHALGKLIEVYLRGDAVVLNANIEGYRGFLSQPEILDAWFTVRNFIREENKSFRAHLEQLKTGVCHDYQSAMEAVEAKSVCGDIVSTHLGNGEKWYQTVFTKKEADAIKSALQIAQSLPATPNEMEG